MSVFTIDTARKASMPYKFGARGLWHPDRMSALRGMIAAGTLTDRMAVKWANIMSRPASYTIAGPPDEWYVPGFYVDPDAAEILHAKVRADGTAAVDYALRYAILGNEADAEQAAAILTAYSTITDYVDADDSPLSWHRRWLLFVQAARMLEGSAAYTSTIEDDFKAATLLGLNSLSRIYRRHNNWGTVGIASEIALSSFFGDREWFDRMIRTWYLHFDSSIKSGIELGGEIRNNIPIHEIFREGNTQGNGSHGLVYTNMTLAALAMGAEYARLNGEWLFDHESRDGSSLRGLYEQTAFWCRYPTPENLWFNTSNQHPESSYYNTGYGITYGFPWFYILGALWPTEDVHYLQAEYPLTQSQDVYTLRHADLLYGAQPLVD